MIKKRRPRKPKVGASTTAWTQEVGRKPLHAFSALTSKEGGNAARLPEAIAAATSL